MAFVTKTGNDIQTFSTGMVRDTQAGKVRYDLLPIFMLRRWAELLTRGAAHYGDNNWTKASTNEEYERFKASAWRHFMQLMNGERDEDHAAAVIFNITGMELVHDKLNSKVSSDPIGDSIRAGS